MVCVRGSKQEGKIRIAGYLEENLKIVKLMLNSERKSEGIIASS